MHSIIAPGTFHRRDLNAPCISFSSPSGRKLFKSSLEKGMLECYFPLAEQFTTQGHPSFCGIGSLTMALNAILLDPSRPWQGSVWRWFDESMLDCCDSQDVIKAQGITMAKLACLAKCNGAEVLIRYGTSVTLEQFREEVIAVSSSEALYSKPSQSNIAAAKVIIASYSRPVLSQSGSGHFSPLGGYDPDSDMVLIMDVARFKYPPHWCPLETLYRAMQPVDSDSGRSRGYLVVSASSGLLEKCCQGRQASTCEDSDSNGDINIGETSPITCESESKKRSCEEIISDIEDQSSSSASELRKRQASNNVESHIETGHTVNKAKKSALAAAAKEDTDVTDVRASTTTTSIALNSRETGVSLSGVGDSISFSGLQTDSEDNSRSRLGSDSPDNDKSSPSLPEPSQATAEAGPSGRLQSLLSHSCSCCSSCD